MEEKSRAELSHCQWSVKPARLRRHVCDASVKTSRWGVQIQQVPRWGSVETRSRIEPGPVIRRGTRTPPAFWITVLLFGFKRRGFPPCVARPSTWINPHNENRSARSRTKRGLVSSAGENPPTHTTRQAIFLVIFRWKVSLLLVRPARRAEPSRAVSAKQPWQKRRVILGEFRSKLKAARIVRPVWRRHQNL